jgi:hypothetical protein
MAEPKKKPRPNVFSEMSWSAFILSALFAAMLVFTLFFRR